MNERVQSSLVLYFLDADEVPTTPKSLPADD